VFKVDFEPLKDTPVTTDPFLIGLELIDLVMSVYGLGMIILQYVIR
jgi:hypothetical protein